ncbi:substrate-binding periplasmic protein [Pseudoalteromonas fenneropenaei]|uniref:Substrate-binding periplasmic protein n=1 Tax=Pseudoalteromonas fenneropenaei TaxID=1737459 RepID=A0ABV7CK07_9GAMM
MTRGWFFLWVFLSGAWSAAVHADAQCELKVRFENYAELARQDEELRWHGLDVDFAKALLDKAGCRYRFIGAPWGRGMKMLELGEIDLVLSVSKNPEREKFAYFIGPQRQETIVFAMNRHKPYELNSLPELFALAKPVAIARGAFYGREFATRLNEMADAEQQFVFVPDNKLKIGMLQKQRIAGFLEEKYNLIYQQQNNPDYADVVISDFIVNQEPVYYAFSKVSVDEHLYRRLLKAYHSLQNSGELQTILHKYKLN